jgi:4-hydroxyacetophenone monooxygenase
LQQRKKNPGVSMATKLVHRFRASTRHFYIPRRSFAIQQWTTGPAVLPTLSDAAISHNLSEGNLGLLQVCTAHLSGEAQWLQENEGPKLRAKLASVMMELRDNGKATVAPDCSPIFKDLVKHSGLPMPLDGFAQTTHEITPLQLEYIMDEMRGFPDEQGGDYTDLLPERKQDFHVSICGSGVNGLSVALRCQRAGIPYTVFERDTDITGTWHQNFYPGVRCDTPSIIYSFSSDPNPNWKKYFADGAEVKTYLKRMADKYGITPNCKTETNVESATWDEESSKWIIRYKNKDGSVNVIRSNVYVGAVGQLSNPSIPEIPGQNIFQGQACHTARYIKDLDFTGKNVVVMGSGATAMGICPEIQKVAKHLTIFQGTPQWYTDVPNHKKRVSDEEQWCMRHVPFYERWYRFQTLRHVVDSYTDVLTTGSDANKALQANLTEYIKEKVNHDPELVKKMVPPHPPICTRLLVDNNWCTMMLEDNVTLVNGRAKEIKERQVIGSNGEVAPADIIIYATGFQTSRFCTSSMKVFGKDGVALEDDWGAEPTAYLGMTRPRFPNFFMTYGPNTNVSSGGSIIWCAETAGRYIGQCCAAMVRDGLKELSVKQDVHDKYNDMITEELKWTAWNDSGCSSWYKKGATGKVTNNLPMGLEEFWSKTRRVNLDDFDKKRLDVNLEVNPEIDLEVNLEANLDDSLAKPVPAMFRL